MLLSSKHSETGQNVFTHFAPTRIHELLHWFDAADLVLAEVLEDTLSREELGLGVPVVEPADE
jgi:hypothetical protein